MNVSHKYIKKKHVFRLLIWYKNPWQKHIFKINIRWLFCNSAEESMLLAFESCKEAGAIDEGFSGHYI